MNDLAIKIRTAPLGKSYLFATGQAGFVVKSQSGSLLGLDLYLTDCVERFEGHEGFRRLLPRVLEPAELDFAGIVATHAHYDHFDMDAVPQIMANPETELFASLKCRDEVKRLIMSEKNCRFVAPGDVGEVSGFKLNFVRCDHGEGAPDAVGVVVEFDGKRIYFVGDSCLRLDMIDDIRNFGELDVLIAPINGANGNLDERECAILADLLKPKITIPCHYGMFASHLGDPGRFYDLMKREFPQNNFVIMPLCGKLTI